MLVTPTEAARRLGIGRARLMEAIAAGTIPATFIGGRWAISEEVVERLLAGELVTPREKAS